MKLGKKMLIGSLALLAFLIAGCGSKTENESIGDAEVNKGSSITPGYEAITIGEYLNTKAYANSVWYEVKDDEIGKDTTISEVVVFDGKGKAKVIHFGYLPDEMKTLGDVSKMSDATIIEELDKNLSDKLKRSITSFKNGALDDLNRTEDSVKNNGATHVTLDEVETVKKKVQESLDGIDVPKKIPFKPIKIILNTDSTGNQTATENLSLPMVDIDMPNILSGENNVDVKAVLNDPNAFEAGMEYTDYHAEIIMGTTPRWATVYDSNYNILPLEDGYSFVFRTKKQVSLSFDQPDSKIKNLEVDPK